MVCIQSVNISFLALIYHVLISTTLIKNANSDIISTNANHQYENQTIHCTSNEPCKILCQHDNSCKSTEIFCPSNYPCDITCNADTACANTIIHAQDSSFFQLLDCATGSFTCKGITIYFPPNNNGKPRAKIIGADRGLSAGELLNDPLQFYAIYGWNDINITTGIKFSYQHHSGIMHCTNNLQITCPFDNNAWTCANSNDICNNPPTISPTYAPTKSQKQSDEINNNKSIQSTESTPIITTTTLYIIIAFLLIFLCCFGAILAYYMYYSQLYNEKVDKSISNLNKIPQLTMKSHPIGSHSTTINTNVASPISKYSQSTMNISNNSTDALSISSITKSKNGNKLSNHNNTELMPIKNKQDHNSSSDTDLESDHKIPETPQIYFANTPQQQQQHYITQLMAAQQQLQQQQHNINPYIPPPPVSVLQQKYQISIPSRTNTNNTITDSLSHQQQHEQIVYQQPFNQHHMLQMMSMMNQSAPPSLSSFINGNNGNNKGMIMDQTQPIPPSISNTPNNSYLQPRQRTITSEFTIPPPESITFGTAENSKNNQEEISDSDNILTRK